MNKKGFTLAELLIVVAIIAVLVAIGIPVFTTQLEKSREATDLANVRSAYAEVMIQAQESVDESFSKTVDLVQAQDGWQSKDEINIGGISSKTDFGTKWIGSPKAKGQCIVSYNGQNGITFNWGGFGTALNKRWLYVTEENVNYMKPTYSDFTDGYKASVIADLIPAKSGQKITFDSLSTVSKQLDSEYTYRFGYFEVDSNIKNADGYSQVNYDSKEWDIPKAGGEYTVNGNDVGIAFQFFKKKDGKTYDLTQSELDALASLISIK